MIRDMCAITCIMLLVGACMLVGGVAFVMAWSVVFGVMPSDIVGRLGMVILGITLFNGALRLGIMDWAL